MSNFWRIGSRWSNDGAWNSRIFKVFRRSGVVFIGSDAVNKMDNVVPGDYFAVADGRRIVAVAMALEKSRDLQEMIEGNLIRVKEGKDYLSLKNDYSGCKGVRVKFVDLPDELQFDCWPCQSFVQIWDRGIQKKIQKFYDEGVESRFNIKASTYRLLNTDGVKDDKQSILIKDFYYIIPKYQREYSWKDEYVTRFIEDLFDGFWGSDEFKDIRREPMFIGTMQLSGRNSCDECDVIDGQQRLSTMLCILKYLKLSYPSNPILHGIALDWLETKVNNGKEQSFLSAMTSLDSMENLPLLLSGQPTNRYLQNLSIIANCFRIIIVGSSINFDEHLNDFIGYLLNDVYFVVVETCATLSKTLKIFDSINTAGMPLGADDLFKIRMYDYLREVEHADDNAFDKINGIYKQIKEVNETNNVDITIKQVLQTYKHLLIAKYNLPQDAYYSSPELFFNDVFDALVERKKPKYPGIKNIKLSIDEIERIIDIRCFRNSSKDFEQYISYNLLCWTRYCWAKDIAYIILMRDDMVVISELERIDRVYEALYFLARYAFYCNMKASKTENQVKAEIYRIYKEAYSAEWQDFVSRLRDKVSKIDDTDIEGHLSKRIFCYPQKYSWTNAMCHLSEFFYEVAAGNDLQSIKTRLKLDYDVEHIHATADNTIEFNDEELQNGIGNLMMLEPRINRSIGKMPFAEKLLRYNESEFACAQHMKTYPQWSEEEAKQRRKYEVDAMIAFLRKPYETTIQDFINQLLRFK